ncbi:MAG: hypothetical protein HQL54_13930 [Magnetococcales bacterium]|nr:hypothetical protein [Magnetococcales bacterium]
MFDHHIIDQVIELWEKDNSGDSSRPRFRHVKQIMEIVYLAGLKREEERPVQLCVALAQSDTFPDWGLSGEQMVVKLEKRLPFSVDSLVKLAPAFDPSTTIMAVSQVSDEPDELEIWGAVFTTERGHNRFDPLPFGVNQPDLLIISSRIPGSLSVHRGSLTIARFNAGKFSQPTPTPFTSTLIGWSILRVIREHPEYKRYGTRYWRTYRDLINELLQESSERGHGGSIIWIPESLVTQTRHRIVSKHVISNNELEGVPLLGELCAMETLQGHTSPGPNGIPAPDPNVLAQAIIACKRKVVEHVELLAQFTRVDGALIISDRLRPISFGSVLMARTWPHEVVVGSEEGFPQDTLDTSRYGTRHNSAVNFVGHSPGSVAFVLSQDGPIAGLTRRDDEAVYWWPDCLSRIWVG